MSEKYWRLDLQFVPQYAPICDAVPCWLQIFQLWRKGNAAVLQFVTAIRLLFVPGDTLPICTGDTLRNTRGRGFRKVPKLSTHQHRESLNGHRYTATGNGQKTINKKHPDRFRNFFACFRSFSTLFCTFAFVFALLGLSISVRFWPSVLAPFACLPFSGCHLDFPDNSAIVDDFFMSPKKSETVWTHILYKTSRETGLDWV